MRHLVLFLRRSPGSAMTSIKTWEKQPRSGQWVRAISQWCGGLLLSSPNSGLGTLRNDPATERETVHRIVLFLHLLQTKTRRILPSTRVFVVLMAAVNTGHQDRTLKTWYREERKRAADGLEGEEHLVRAGGGAFQQLCVSHMIWHFQFWTTLSLFYTSYTFLFEFFYLKVHLFSVFSEAQWHLWPDSNSIISPK